MYNLANGWPFTSIPAPSIAQRLLRSLTYGQVMRLTLPTVNDLADLTKHRDAASVSIYLPSSPLPDQAEAVQIALKSTIAQAEGQLVEIGISRAEVADIMLAVRDLDSDREFWRYQAHAMAVFVAPGLLRAFRLANALDHHLAVGDRFDIGPLLRSVTFAHGGYLLALAEGDIRLYELSADQRPIELQLELPDDLDTVLELAENEGRLDQRRAKGATGQRIEQQRYCRLVQDAVLQQVGESTLPMILVASRDLEPAYRAVNSYVGLLETGIDAHPESLTTDELDARARTILDEHYAGELAEWRERFGTQRSNGVATSQLSEAARAATASAVEELLFDMDSTLEGSIDDVGVVHPVDEPGPTSYGIVDEIAVRVLRSGGTVKAVRAGDLPDDTPVAAMLRYPL